MFFTIFYDEKDLSSAKKQEIHKVGKLTFFLTLTLTQKIYPQKSNFLSINKKKAQKDKILKEFKPKE